MSPPPDLGFLTQTPLDSISFKGAAAWSGKEESKTSVFLAYVFSRSLRLCVTQFIPLKTGTKESCLTHLTGIGEVMKGMFKAGSIGILWQTRRQKYTPVAPAWEQLGHLSAQSMPTDTDFCSAVLPPRGAPRRGSTV